jgi:hypothetical protein
MPFRDNQHFLSGEERTASTLLPWVACKFLDLTSPQHQKHKDDDDDDDEDDPSVTSLSRSLFMSHKFGAMPFKLERESKNVIKSPSTERYFSASRPCTDYEAISSEILKLVSISKIIKVMRRGR